MASWRKWTYSFGSKCRINWTSNGAVSLGIQAGQYNQSSGAVAIGYQTGQIGQGNYATAIQDTERRTRQGKEIVLWH
jgi:hypothetical protein